MFALSELASALMGPDSREDYVDKIWARLVDRARHDGELWITISAGLAMPGLRTSAKRALFVAADRTLQFDIESATLMGFTEALRAIDTGEVHLCRKLCNQAYLAARRVANDHARYQASQASGSYEPSVPKSPSRHVDLLLAEAVADGALTAVEAEIIGATRLEKQRLTAIARAQNLHPSVLSRRRHQAESRLVEWLRPENKDRDWT